MIRERFLRCFKSASKAASFPKRGKSSKLALPKDFTAYEFHQQNISALMRVQKYLTPTVLQFCSPLNDLNTVLSQLQVSPPDQAKSYSLLIESEPELRDEMIQEFKGEIF